MLAVLLVAPALLMVLAWTRIEARRERARKAGRGTADGGRDADREGPHFTVSIPE